MGSRYPAKLQLLSDTEPFVTDIDHAARRPHPAWPCHCMLIAEWEVLIHENTKNLHMLIGNFVFLGAYSPCLRKHVKYRCELFSFKMKLNISLNLNTLNLVKSRNLNMSGYKLYC